MSEFLMQDGENEDVAPTPEETTPEETPTEEETPVDGEETTE